MQLNTLLDSMFFYWKSPSISVNVFYNSSSVDFEKGYERLKVKFPLINWYKESEHKRRFVWPLFPMYWRNYYWWFKYKHNRWIKSNFKTKVLSILENDYSDFVMFLTDDSLFISPIEINNNALTIIKQNELDNSFSLRHGKNIIGGKYSEVKSNIEWNIFDNNMYSVWNYPFSVDGHIYSKNSVKDILRQVIFKNPNTLEGNVACYVREKRLFKHIMANQKSCLVGFELNKVQNVNNNNNLNISAQLLNNYFLQGYSLKTIFDNGKIETIHPHVNSVELIKKNVETIKIY